MKLFISFSVAASLLFAGCGNEHRPVPRPYAWPRTVMMGDSLREIDFESVKWLVNSEADVTVRRATKEVVWVDISYPPYNATLYLTISFAEGAALDSAIDNRLQRISLNLGQASAERRDISSTSGEFEGIMLRATSPVTTPLQFLATDDKRVAVSGVLVMEQAAVNPDSLAPAIYALHSEFKQALSSLSYDI